MEEFKVGDKVTNPGNPGAHHAEILSVVEARGSKWYTYHYPNSIGNSVYVRRAVDVNWEKIPDFGPGDILESNKGCMILVMEDGRAFRVGESGTAWGFGWDRIEYYLSEPNLYGTFKKVGNLPSGMHLNKREI